jgi:uncharacterized protein YjdB
MKGFLVLCLFALSTIVSANTYYVAPSGGSNNYPGTITQPWATWQKAFDSAHAGDTVYFRGGVWYPTTYAVHDPSTGHGFNGTYSDPVCFFNYPGEEAIFDASNFSSVTNYTILIDHSTYIKFRGLTIRNHRQTSAGQTIVGVTLANGGNYYLERVVSHNNGGHGFQVLGYDTLSYLNCDSYYNADPLTGGNTADGFAGGSGGTVNDTLKIAYYIGCRAWNNSDDGFDLGTTKQFLLHGCWAFLNGYPTLGPMAEGDGLKTNISEVRIPGKRRIENSLSAFNKGGAFTHQNLNEAFAGPVVDWVNNTAYKCYDGLFFTSGDFVQSLGGGRVFFRNNIVYRMHGYNAIPFCWTDLTYFTQQNNNIIMKMTDPYYSYWSEVTVTDADFVLTDSITGIAQLTAPRKADGSLPDITFLKLAPTSDLIDKGVNVGLPFFGNAPDLGAFEYGAPNSKPVTSITVSGTGGATTISTDNGTLQLIANVLPADATNKSVTWSISSGTDKAVISSTGLVTALDNGIVVARATANDGSAVFGTLSITISNQVIPVSSISVTAAGGATTISTDNGTLQLTANVLPANANNKTVTWSITSGPDKALISSTGLVTALANGTAVARATANDGSGVYGLFTITISNQIILVTSIVVSATGGTTTITTDGGTLQLSALVLPSNATNPAVTWSISNGTDKASITSTGLVTALDNGTAVARATAKDGSGTYGSLTMTISNQVITVTGISVTGAGGATLITLLGGTLQLSASVLPANASNKTVNWSITSGSDKASISSTGLITALANGTAVARATANDGSGVYGTLAITISNQVIPVTSITVSGGTAITTDGGVLQLSAGVLPSNSTNPAVTWSISTGTDKASISSTGLVTALDNGSAVARATANDGSGVYGILTITISNQKIPVTSISVTGSGGATIISRLNGTLQLIANVLPANATNKLVTWTITSGTDKASISSAGLVTALDNGTVVARATANDGSGVYGILTITIINQVIPVSSITVTGTGGATTINSDKGTLQLIANVLPVNAANKTVTWAIISGSDKVSISSAGLLTALDNGTAVASATANDGSGVIGILTITISNQVIPVTNISVSATGGVTTISEENGTLQLIANVFPSDATNTAVTWSISNGADLASINSTGLVTAIDTGSVTVRATANDGSEIYGTFVISISDNDNSPPAGYERLPVKIYPNPAGELVTIRIDEPTLIPDFIQLVNLSGIIVLRLKLNRDEREFSIPIDLKSGFYIVQLITGSLTQFTQKLIISR